MSYENDRKEANYQKASKEETEIKKRTTRRREQTTAQKKTFSRSRGGRGWRKTAALDPGDSPPAPPPPPVPRWSAGGPTT